MKARVPTALKTPTMSDIKSCSQTKTRISVNYLRTKSKLNFSMMKTWFMMRAITKAPSSFQVGSLLTGIWLMSWANLTHSRMATIKMITTINFKQITSKRPKAKKSSSESSQGKLVKSKGSWGLLSMRDKTWSTVKELVQRLLLKTSTPTLNLTSQT